jgi:hypothetical protein
LRLAAEADFPLFGDAGDLTFFTAGGSSARFCTDVEFQWDKSAPIDERRAQFEAARAALDPKRFGPFSVAAWTAPPPLNFFPDPCIAWPAPTHDRDPVVPEGATAGDVPALILAGDLDLLLTLKQAGSLRRVFPNARVVEVRGGTHITVFSPQGDCVRPIVHRFVNKKSLGDLRCLRQVAITFPAVGRFPETIAEARQADVASPEDDSAATDRRIGFLAAAAVTDAFRRAFIGGPTDHGRGLRGGFANYDFDDSAALFDVALDSYANDLAITGRGRYDFATSFLDATVAVLVPGSFGQVQVSGVWFGPGATTLEVNGQIGGRRVVLRVPAV